MHLSKLMVMLGSVLPLASLACNDEPTEAGLNDCTGPVALQVSGGTVPSFSWTPACRLFGLLVEPEASGQDLWFIITEGGNTIAPGVTYGQVPAGAEERQPPAALLAGTAYKVAVHRWIGPGGDDGELIGVQSFTP
jgi:hypothetical protein